MYPLYFSAALRAGDGKFLEAGEACLAEQEDSVLFNSDFVPLLQLGSTAQIVRVLGERQFECFTGKVYLSSRKLLQLVEVDAKTMDTARALFSVNENIPVQLALAPGASPRFNLQKADKIAGNIRFIGAELIKIVAIEFIPIGQLFVFSIETPAITLTDLKACVRERILLKKNAAVLLCDILTPTGTQRRAISSFLDRQRPQALML